MFGIPAGRRRLAPHAACRCTFALIILVSYAYSPRGYAVAGRSITVGAWPARSASRWTTSANCGAATPGRLPRHASASAASGGLFGYYGLFRTSKLGKFSWYVTNRKNSVVVITGAKTTLVSPDDVEGFLNAVRASAPVPASAIRSRHWTPRADPERSQQSSASPSGLERSAWSQPLMSYSPGPPSYTLTPAALTIHDRFYPVTLKRDSIELSQIRVIDLGADPYWRPAGRANGFREFALSVRMVPFSQRPEGAFIPDRWPAPGAAAVQGRCRGGPVSSRRPGSIRRPNS